MTDKPLLISQEQFRTEMTSTETLTIIDVRSHEEYQAGHIDGAIHIPAGELAARAGELPAAGKVVAVCNLGGARSCGAAAQLKEAGYDARALEGGVAGLQKKS